ncbi:MAG: hypothetical protein ACRC46_11295 [Thermoguttaceae bacterium]
MASKSRSKSAPTTTPTDATTKSGKEKPLAPFAPGIGEYVQKAIEVAKLSKTLQERIRIIAYAGEDYTQHEGSKDFDCPKEIELWSALYDAKNEVVKTVKDTWDAITGLYDVIQSPPPGFEKVAASLAAVVSIIKVFYRVPDRGIDACGICWRLLRTANERLDAAILSLQWHLFSFVPSALPDDENSNAESSLADIHKDCVAEIDAKQRFVLDEANRYGWQHALSLLQEKDPNSHEWEGITSDSDEFLIEEACSRYLERKAREQFNAKTDENYRQLVKAIVATMPTVAPDDVAAALSKLQSDAEREADMICRLQEVCLPSDASNYKAAAKIAIRLDKWKKVNDRCREIHRLVGYRPEATAEQIGAALEPIRGRAAVGRTKFWQDLLVLRAKIKEDTELAKRAANGDRWNEN